MPPSPTCAHKHPTWDSSASLTDLTNRAETVAKRLELMVASMHDLPDADEAKDKGNVVSGPVFTRRSAGG